MHPTNCTGTKCRPQSNQDIPVVAGLWYHTSPIVAGPDSSTAIWWLCSLSLPRNYTCIAPLYLNTDDSRFGNKSVIMWVIYYHPRASKPTNLGTMSAQEQLHLTVLYTTKEQLLKFHYDTLYLNNIYTKICLDKVSASPFHIPTFCTKATFSFYYRQQQKD